MCVISYTCKCFYGKDKCLSNSFDYSEDYYYYSCRVGHLLGLAEYQVNDLFYNYVMEFLGDFIVVYDGVSYFFLLYVLTACLTFVKNYRLNIC